MCVYVSLVCLGAVACLCVPVSLCGCVYLRVSMQVYVHLCVCLCVHILCMWIYMCVAVRAHVLSILGIFLCSSPFDYFRKYLLQKLELTISGILAGQ